MQISSQRPSRHSTEHSQQVQADAEGAKQGVMFCDACSNLHEHHALLWSGGHFVKGLQVVDDADGHASQTPEVAFCVQVEVRGCGEPHMLPACKAGCWAQMRWSTGTARCSPCARRAACWAAMCWSKGIASHACKEGPCSRLGLEKLVLSRYAAGCTWLSLSSPMPCRQAALFRMQAVTCGP